MYEPWLQHPPPINIYTVSTFIVLAAVAVLFMWAAGFFRE